jgi:hypothetical protein
MMALIFSREPILNILSINIKGDGGPCPHRPQLNRLLLRHAMDGSKTLDQRPAINADDTS